MSNLLEDFKRIAAEQVAQYPQYRGHFDGYVLVRVKRDVRTKFGLAFIKGELAIAKPTGEGDFRTVWSIRNKIDTAIPARVVVEVQ